MSGPIWRGRGSRRAAVVCILLLIASATSIAADDSPDETLREGWYARIVTTKGEIMVRLLPDQAPQAVAHFAALVRGELGWSDPVSGEEYREPYFDGAPVHYAKAGMTFEVGRRSGPGGVAPFIYVPLEGTGPVSFYEAGRLGLGRSPLGRTSGVIFFVTVTPQPWLNGDHPCFAEVVSGLDVAFAITEVKTYTNTGRPIDEIRVDKIEILAVGDPPPLPEPKAHVPTMATPTPVK